MIKREDLDKLDLSDVIDTDEKYIERSAPGEILKYEFMVPLELSANALAKQLKVPTNRITAILNVQRRVTADTALRLGKLFGTTPEFWLGLQSAYDLEKAKSENDLSDILPIAA